MTRGDAEMPRPIKVNICVFLWFKQKVRSVFQSKSPGRNLDVPDVRPTDVPLIYISFFSSRLRPEKTLHPTGQQTRITQDPVSKSALVNSERY